MPGKDIARAGGTDLARTFIKLGFVDEYLFTADPMILGAGKPLLATSKEDVC